MVCGYSVAQPVAKAAVPNWEQLPEWDVLLNQAYIAASDAKSLQASVDKRATERAEYHKYLQTERWRTKSRTVLQRDPVCKACGAASSEQAHHLTYDRIYREPLFDLVGVCRPCHARLHRHDELDEAIESVEPSDEDLTFG
jgi:hypothetical protein